MLDKTDYPDVNTLSCGVLEITPQDRDWSEGYGGAWEYIEAPQCTTCGTTCAYVNGVDEMIDALGVSVPDDGDDRDVIEARMDGGADFPTWRCANLDCERHCEEIDRFETTDGPMMNYAYPFPDTLDETDAAKIANLPLCIVQWQDGRTELALSGGGMDLSWEICEAFMRLGQLPPVHFAELPAMSGRGKSDLDKWIMSGCERAATESAARASYRADRIIETLARIAGDRDEAA